MQVITSITYESLFGRRLAEDELLERVRALSLNDCLQSLGKLANAVVAAEHDRSLIPEFVQVLIAGLPPTAAMRLVEQLQGRAARQILFGKQLMTLARTALLHAERRDPDSFRQRGDWHLFVEALFGVLDVYDREEERLADVQDGPEAEESFMSFRLRRVGMPHRELRHSIVRAFRVFVDLPALHPELAAARAPAEAFELSIGVPLDRYLAICFAAYGRFSSWTGNADEWLLGDSYWRETSVDLEQVRRSLASSAL